MTTKDTTIDFSSILSSIKNPEPMTRFDLTILAFAFFANCLQIDFQSAFLGWCSIRIAKMVSKSMNWLLFRRFTNELFGGVCLGFIRSRGRLRPSRKPPETTKKKSRPSLGNRCSFVLAIAILSIAFYLNSNLIWNAISELQLNSKYGCHVTGITLSVEQKALADERVKKEGICHLITFEVVNYCTFARRLHNRGKFDRVISCEMIEAVGHNHLGEFFWAVEQVLKYCT